MDKQRTITVPAGIGDFLWMAMKLGNQPEKFHIKLPDGQPQRGHQILELLPNLVHSYEYTPGLNYKKINEGNIQRKKKRWSEIKDQSFFLSANEWLEQGKRLENWLPDLPIRYRLEYATKDNDKLKAQSLLFDQYHYIGIYGSAYSNARNWGMWGHEEWFTLARLLYTRNKDTRFVLIGASYDTDLADQLKAKFYEYRIPYVDTVGEPLSVVIEVLKRLTYFLGFPSGLSILNETLGKDTLMFYPKHLVPMMNAWAEPSRIASGQYKACEKCSPEVLFDWLKNDYELFKKLG